MRDAATVDVAIPTFRRPDQLRRALASVLDQEVRGFARGVVLVIESDPDRSAEAVAQEFAGQGVQYVPAGARGLVAARNRALASATGDYLAWLDDDEIASPTWLAELVAALTVAPDVTVVGAPVVGDRADATAGQAPVLLGAGWQAARPLATNNLLVRMAEVRRWDLRFDETFSACGGEDSDFLFRWALTADLTVAWAPSAVVVEPPAPERASEAYRAYRAYRNGYVHQRFLAAHGSAYGSRAEVRAPQVFALARLVTGIRIGVRDGRLELRLGSRFWRGAGMLCDRVGIPLAGYGGVTSEPFADDRSARATGP